MMGEEQGPYQEGKRAGLHPLIVVFGVLLGLWLFVALIVPSSRNKQATGTEGPAGPVIEDPEAAPVIFKVQSTVSDMNAVSVVVPTQATESQVVALLKRLKKERLAGTLTRGAHAPGGLYPDRVPFEVAMEEIRGHYRIDLNNTGAPDTASIGFADESGVHSKHYRKIF